MSFKLYYDADTSRALKAFQHVCGGETTLLQAALKAVRLVDAVVSLEGGGYSPCLYTKTGKPEVISLSKLYNGPALCSSNMRVDDCKTLSLEDHELDDLKKLRDELESKGVLKGRGNTLGETLEAAADISAKLVLEMRQNRSDLARMDGRRQFIPVIIHGHPDLHILNARPAL